MSDEELRYVSPSQPSNPLLWLGDSRTRDSLSVKNRRRLRVTRTTTTTTIFHTVQAAAHPVAGLPMPENPVTVSICWSFQLLSGCPPMTLSCLRYSGAHMGELDRTPA
ncbi:hypothetical protein AGIG_G3270 [Arapaima gigas]